MELPGKRELREQILHQMDGRTSYVSDKDVYREIDKAILRSSHGGYGTLSEKEELRRQMFYSIRGFDVLEKYLGDSSISEIMVIGASRIFVEQNGKIRRIEEHFSEEGDVYRLIEQIVAPTNRMVNEACPIVDSRLPDGSRVHIVLPPVSLREIRQARQHRQWKRCQRQMSIKHSGFLIMTMMPIVPSIKREMHPHLKSILGR